MNKRRTRTSELYSWKWIVFIVVLFPYEATLRDQLIRDSERFGLDINLWDLILYSINNHILIFYFLLPSVLFYSCYVILKEWNHTILIRTGSFHKWMVYTSFKLGKNLFWMHIIWFSVILLLSRGIPFEYGWSSYAGNDQIPGNYSVVLQEAGLAPQMALIMQPFLLCSSLIAIHMSISAIHVMVPGQHILTFMAVIYFLGGLISFRFIPPWFIWIKLENFMILSSAAYSWPSIWIAFVVPFVAMLFFILLVFIGKKGIKHQ